MRKPKLRNILPQRKNYVKSVRKQYGNPDSHASFNLFVGNQCASLLVCEIFEQLFRLKCAGPLHELPNRLEDSRTLPRSLIGHSGQTAEASQGTGGGLQFNL